MSPADAVFGLAAGELTPAARELVALAGTLAGFAEAAEKILPRMAGLRVSESTAERTTEAAGAALGARLAAGEVLGAPRAWDWSRDAAGRTVAYVSAGATGVGIQGPGGAAADGRMADVGLVFDGAEPGRARALAGLYDLPGLGEQLRRQAAQVGMDAAEVWVGLTDGGSGLDDFIRAYFPRAELVLDFYHAAAHLNELAEALHPSDEAAAGALAGVWCHALKHQGGPAVLAALEAVDLRGRKAEVRERHRQVTGYVRGNAHRMDYPRYRANGWLIGSGHVEAACKAVVGQRLKGNGMRWSEAGADAVCHLRARFMSEKGQWDDFWALAP